MEMLLYLCSQVPKFYDERPAAVICKYKSALQDVEKAERQRGRT